MEKEKKQQNKKITRARVFDFRYLLYDIGRIIAAPSWFLWFRPKWKFESDLAKKKIRGGAVLSFNHTGILDPARDQFAVWYRRMHFVAAVELSKTPFSKWIFANFFHCIAVDRTNFNLGTFREITDHLVAGNVISIYPEGHVNVSEEGLNAFKSGVVMMAIRSGRPIVPIYSMTPKKWYKRTVYCIGEPIDVRTRLGAMPSIDAIQQFSEFLREKETQLRKIAEGDRT